MRYRVKHITEEFSCPACGGLVYVGDGAWQGPDDGPCFCSASCAGADPRRQGPDTSPGVCAPEGRASILRH